jgi:glutamate-1-semialdehyde 2,1-aminomutase
MKTYQKSRNLFKKAQSLIPGGVNSPVRACRSVGIDPLFIEKAVGSHLTDADGNTFIDYVGSWGPMILGHSHPSVIRALEKVLTRGTSFGAPVDLEVELAELIVARVPAIEKIRMVNSGTEATMSAVRVARGVTGRNTIIKFDGCYHGHADSFLVAAGSGVATLNIAGSPGVPDSVIAHTLSLPYNDVEAFQSVMQKSGDEIAAVIVEPVAGNMGLVPPAGGFLETLRAETEKHGAILIFDEVMTGFRVARGGAQDLFQIEPDMSCFGKIVGGGLPVGAYGGRKEIMTQVAPEGPVYQAGTLSGNPLAMAAGIATLKALDAPEFYKNLERTAGRLADGLAAAAGTNAVVNRVGSMLGLFFTAGPVTDFETAKMSDLDKFTAYYQKMLEKGIYLAPSQFEALFVSAAHTDEDIDATIFAAKEVLTALSVK